MCAVRPFVTFIHFIIIFWRFLLKTHSSWSQLSAAACPRRGGLGLRSLRAAPWGPRGLSEQRSLRLPQSIPCRAAWGPLTCPTRGRGCPLCWSVSAADVWRSRRTFQRYSFSRLRDLISWSHSADRAVGERALGPVSAGRPPACPRPLVAPSGVAGAMPRGRPTPGPRAMHRRRAGWAVARSRLPAPRKGPGHWASQFSSLVSAPHTHTAPESPLSPATWGRLRSPCRWAGETSPGVEAKGSAGRVPGFTALSSRDGEGGVWGPSTLCPPLPWPLCPVVPAHSGRGCSGHVRLSSHACGSMHRGPQDPHPAHAAVTVGARPALLTGGSRPGPAAPSANPSRPLPPQSRVPNTCCSEPGPTTGAEVWAE